MKFPVHEGGKSVEVSKFFLDADLTSDGPYTRSFKATQQGDLNGAQATVTLRRIDLTKIPLLTRGFHWINENPFNR